jgi:hypothetical protein
MEVFVLSVFRGAAAILLAGGLVRLCSEVLSLGSPLGILSVDYGVRVNARVLAFAVAAAHRLFSNVDPLGRYASIGEAPQAHTYQVIGVISDVRFRSPRQKDTPIRTCVPQIGVGCLRASDLAAERPGRSQRSPEAIFPRIPDYRLAYKPPVRPFYAEVALDKTRRVGFQAEGRHSCDRCCPTSRHADSKWAAVARAERHREFLSCSVQIDQPEPGRVPAPGD